MLILATLASVVIGAELGAIAALVVANRQAAARLAALRASNAELAQRLAERQARAHRLATQTVAERLAEATQPR